MTRPLLGGGPHGVFRVLTVTQARRPTPAPRGGGDRPRTPKGHVWPNPSPAHQPAKHQRVHRPALVLRRLVASRIETELRRHWATVLYPEPPTQAEPYRDSRRPLRLSHAASTTDILGAMPVDDLSPIVATPCRDDRTTIANRTALHGHGFVSAAVHGRVENCFLVLPNCFPASINTLS